MKPRFYRVVYVIDDVALFRHTFKCEPKQTSGVLFPGPLTHEQACTCLRKVTPHLWRRDYIEEIA